MVKISQKDFNRDMDSYLSKRTEYDKIKRPKKEIEEVVPDKKKKDSFISKVVDIVSGENVLEETETELEEEFEEVNEKRSFFSGIKKWFTTETEIEEEEEELTPGLPEDLKDILKIQNKWLKKLSSKDMKSFKSSEDYEKYREVLKKYGLIR